MCQDQNNFETSCFRHDSSLTPLPDGGRQKAIGTPIPNLQISLLLNGAAGDENARKRHDE
jgi:hypothetical protein